MSYGDHSGFAARLRGLRAARGLKQAEVADAVGMARSYLGGVERGHAMPGREVVKALADYYHVSTDWLLDGGHKVKAETEEEAILLGAFRSLRPEGARLVLETVKNWSDLEQNRNRKK